MPRNPPPRPPQGPSLSPEQARIELQRSIERANKLSQEQPLTEQRYRVWKTNTFKVLKAAFGEDSGHLYTFSGQGRLYPAGTPDSYMDVLRGERG